MTVSFVFVFPYFLHDDILFLRKYLQCLLAFKSSLA